MKKISFILIMLLSVVLVACDGNKKAPATETEAAPEVTASEEKQEVVVEETKAVSEVLKEYEATAKKMTEALLGMQKGDVKAIKEYQKLSPEIARLNSTLAERAGEMTAKEAKKYKEIAERLAKSTPSGN